MSKLNTLEITRPQADFLYWLLQFRYYKLSPGDISNIKDALYVNSYEDGMEHQILFNMLRGTWLQEYHFDYKLRKLNTKINIK